MTETVTTSTRFWSEEVALANAQDADQMSMTPGQAALIGAKKDIAYEFSNGRKFEDSNG